MKPHEHMIALLAYALEQNGYQPDRYLIGKAGDEGKIDQLTCLVERDGKWEVFYRERGSNSGMAVFDMLEDASKYYFWCLTYDNDHMDYREAWEKATGLSFTLS